jgi:hypothetical protein
VATYGYTPSYENALDVGDCTVVLSSASYVSSTAKSYSQSFSLDDPHVELSGDSYVSNAAKVYSSLTVDLGDPAVSLGSWYTKANPLRTHQPSALVEMFALPVEEGDTGQLIVFGRLQDETDPLYNPVFDSSRGVVMVPLSFQHCFMLGHAFGSIYEGAMLIKYEERADYQDIITV